MIRFAVQAIVVIVTFVVGQKLIDAYRNSQRCDVHCWSWCDASWSDGSCAMPSYECGCDGGGK